jgi:hypothetical protein
MEHIHHDIPRHMTRVRVRGRNEFVSNLTFDSLLIQVGHFECTLDADRVEVFARNFVQDDEYRTRLAQAKAEFDRRMLLEQRKCIADMVDGQPADASLPDVRATVERAKTPSTPTDHEVAAAIKYQEETTELSLMATFHELFGDERAVMKPITNFEIVNPDLGLPEIDESRRRADEANTLAQAQLAAQAPLVELQREQNRLLRELLQERTAKGSKS